LTRCVRVWTSELVRFAVIGTVAFVVDTGVLYVALANGLGFYSGRAVSYLVAATFTWYGNRRFTFAAARASGGASTIAAEWIRFLSANLVGGAVNYCVYAGLIGVSSQVRALPVLGVAAGSIAGLLVNFTLSKFVVFRSQSSE
jgi:putative flippase GtrA